MSIYRYPDMVRGLCKSGSLIQGELSADDAHNLHMLLGLSGEVGELIDAVKRHVIYRKPLDRDNVIEELGDIEFYLEGLRGRIGITREECLLANSVKLSKRYQGLEYSDKAARERADKEESND